MCIVVFFVKQKTAYEMRISDWSSDVCSSDLLQILAGQRVLAGIAVRGRTIGVRLGEGIADIGVGALDGDDELGRAAEAHVGIQIVVLIAGQHQIFHVRRTAEHLDAVVRAVMDLDMVDLRAGAHRSTISRRSEEHTSETQSIMRLSYAVFFFKKQKS